MRRSIGVALQDAAIDPYMTGRELLHLQAVLHGYPRAVGRARAVELLERVDLVPAADRRVGTYSGGMRRRLDLALALVHEPEVLFLDEPTTGLDPISRLTLWEEVRRLNRDSGTTVFLTTQYLEEADQLAGRVGIIDGGRIVAEGTPGELKAQVGDPILNLTLARARGRRRRRGGPAAAGRARAGARRLPGRARARRGGRPARRRCARSTTPGWWSPASTSRCRAWTTCSWRRPGGGSEAEVGEAARPARRPPRRRDPRPAADRGARLALGARHRSHAPGPGAEPLLPAGADGDLHRVVRQRARDDPRLPAGARVRSTSRSPARSCRASSSAAPAPARRSPSTSRAGSSTGWSPRRSRGSRSSPAASAAGSRWRWRRPCSSWRSGWRSARGSRAASPASRSCSCWPA